ncbi:hypothetical protein HaLaN_22696 [Haematococcus lacustris]|uniref:Uncharacterized protein n=1 Tax=Haematococcus lacustris TaxID=44745 RepID=A0A699ZQ75_HAELA|nr:hypothetical protein HaLaN_22696 [Haematococcus lacustris]
MATEQPVSSPATNIAPSPAVASGSRVWPRQRGGQTLALFGAKVQIAAVIAVGKRCVLVLWFCSTASCCVSLVLLSQHIVYSQRGIVCAIRLRRDTTKNGICRVSHVGQVAYSKVKQSRASRTGQTTSQEKGH